MKQEKLLTESQLHQQYLDGIEADAPTLPGQPNAYTQHFINNSIEAKQKTCLGLQGLKQTNLVGFVLDQFLYPINKK